MWKNLEKDAPYIEEKKQIFWKLPKKIFGKITEIERRNIILLSVAVIYFVWPIDFEDNTEATVKLTYAIILSFLCKL